MKIHKVSISNYQKIREGEMSWAPALAFLSTTPLLALFGLGKIHYELLLAIPIYIGTFLWIYPIRDPKTGRAKFGAWGRDDMEVGHKQ